MKIIIYHGKQGTGKTTQLACAALCCTAKFNDAISIVKARKIVEVDSQKYLFVDEFKINDLPLIDDQTIDWVYIAISDTAHLKVIESYFSGAPDIHEVRETMFPFCHYITLEENKYSAYFGAYRVICDTYDELIGELTEPSREIEVEITDRDGMIKFLSENSTPPNNFNEWGLDYAHLMRFSEKFRKCTSSKIIIKDDEACAITNYNAGEIDWIENLFFPLFTQD